MPAPIAPLIGFALGVILAWTGRRESDRDFDAQPLDGRAGLVAAYGVLVFAPVNAYFLAFAGDWSFAYTFDSRKLPSAVALLMVVLDAAVVWAGFLTGRRLRRTRAAGLAAAVVGIALLVAAAFVLVFRTHLAADATFHQIRSNFGVVPIVASPLGLAVVWMSLMVVLGFAITVKTLSGEQSLPAGAAGTRGARASTQDNRNNPVRRLGAGSLRTQKRPGSVSPD